MINTGEGTVLCIGRDNGPGVYVRCNNENYVMHKVVSRFIHK